MPFTMAQREWALDLPRTRKPASRVDSPTRPSRQLWIALTESLPRYVGRYHAYLTLQMAIHPAPDSVSATSNMKCSIFHHHIHICSCRLVIAIPQWQVRASSDPLALPISNAPHTRRSYPGVPDLHVLTSIVSPRASGSSSKTSLTTSSPPTRSQHELPLLFTRSSAASAQTSRPSSAAASAAMRKSPLTMIRVW